LGLEVTAGSEGLAGLDNVEVLDWEFFAVLSLVEVFLGDEDTFAEDCLVDCFAVGLWN
jgi:hypothetical protein